jgi:hypothetical protein
MGIGMPDNEPQGTFAAPCIVWSDEAAVDRDGNEIMPPELSSQFRHQMAMILAWIDLINRGGGGAALWIGQEGVGGDRHPWIVEFGETVEFEVADTSSVTGLAVNTETDRTVIYSHADTSTGSGAFTPAAHNRFGTIQLDALGHTDIAPTVTTATMDFFNLEAGSSGAIKVDGGNTIDFHASGTGFTVARAAKVVTYTIASGTYVETWTIGADSNAATVANGQTHRILGGTYMDTTLSGRDVTINFDLTEITNGWADNTQQVLTKNASDVFEWVSTESC